MISDWSTAITCLAPALAANIERMAVPHPTSKTTWREEYEIQQILLQREQSKDPLKLVYMLHQYQLFIANKKSLLKTEHKKMNQFMDFQLSMHENSINVE